jgi:hypothetical protein
VFKKSNMGDFLNTFFKKNNQLFFDFLQLIVIVFFVKSVLQPSKTHKCVQLISRCRYEARYKRIGLFWNPLKS